MNTNNNHELLELYELKKQLSRHRVTENKYRE